VGRRRGVAITFIGKVKEVFKAKSEGVSRELLHGKESTVKVK